VTLLLLRSHDPAALMVALGPELRASDMAAHAPAGAVAVLLHDTADEGARLFIERARAGYPAYVQYGYAWTDGNSGPMGLYRVAQEMLLANERVPTPVARAS
jgi:hypothetical protein